MGPVLLFCLPLSTLISASKVGRVPEYKKQGHLILAGECPQPRSGQNLGKIGVLGLGVGDVRKQRQPESCPLKSSPGSGVQPRAPERLKRNLPSLCPHCQLKPGRWQNPVPGVSAETGELAKAASGGVPCFRSDAQAGGRTQVETRPTCGCWWPEMPREGHRSADASHKQMAALRTGRPHLTHRSVLVPQCHTLNAHVPQIHMLKS